MPEQVLAQIHSIFGGIPSVFQQMHESGDLADNWPGLRALYTDEGPLPRAVVDTLLAASALRCRHGHYFVVHSLALVGAGADQVAIENLTRRLEVPPNVPDAERWSRIVRLAWLSDAPGPHRRAAAHGLELACTPEEYEQVMHICACGALLTSYAERNAPVEDEPGFDGMPDELRALVPKFIQYHVSFKHAGASEERPVSTMCSVCRKLRSTTDEQWYPYATAITLLPSDVIFSHGLCEPCVDEMEGL